MRMPQEDIEDFIEFLMEEENPSENDSEGTNYYGDREEWKVWLYENDMDTLNCRIEGCQEDVYDAYAIFLSLRKSKINLKLQKEIIAISI